MVSSEISLNGSDPTVGYGDRIDGDDSRYTPDQVVTLALRDREMALDNIAVWLATGHTMERAPESAQGKTSVYQGNVDPNDGQSGDRSSGNDADVDGVDSRNQWWQEEMNAGRALYTDRDETGDVSYNARLHLDGVNVTLNGTPDGKAPAITPGELFAITRDTTKIENSSSAMPVALQKLDQITRACLQMFRG